MGTFDELLEDANRGDSKAWDEIVRRAWAHARRVAHHDMGRDVRAWEESVDLAQSVARTVWQRRDRIPRDGESAFLRWVGKLTRNRIKDRLRRMFAAKRDVRRVVLNDDLAAVDDRAAHPLALTPSSKAAAREASDHARNQLTPIEAHLFDLRDRGLSWEAVAQQSGLTEGAARKRFERARGRIREAASSPESPSPDE